MARLTKRLTAVKVQGLKAKGLHADGDGLYLKITATGSKSWIYRFTIAGRTRDMGLGKYPEIGLSGARIAVQSLKEKGGDPIEAKALKRLAAQNATAESARVALTFSEACERYLANKLAGYRNAKHRQQWTNTLTAYAVPIIGGKAALTLSRRDILAVLMQPHRKAKQPVEAPLWLGLPETASRLRGRVEKVIDFAAAHEGVEDHLNPARLDGALKMLLPDRPVAPEQHFPAISIADAPAFMRNLQPKESLSARALKFLIYTVTRSGDVRGARWSEVDAGRTLWTIPAERMKVKSKTQPHRVPLSAPAHDLLTSQPRIAGCDLIFPSMQGKPLSDMALSELMRGSKFTAAPPYQDRKPTPHGWRSTFKDWARENTRAPADVVELCLAHKNPDDVERAYGRSDLLELRRELMDAWAAFCDAGGNIVTLRKFA